MNSVKFVGNYLKVLSKNSSFVPFSVFQYSGGKTFVVDQKQLKNRLNQIQYDVTQNQGTERPFTGEYYKFSEIGNYQCVVCNNTLFDHEMKFHSDCGWPAFFKSQENAISYHTDNSYGMSRTEVTCKNCSSHLGHIFDDGPVQKGGMRYCINSASLDFESTQKEKN